MPVNYKSSTSRDARDTMRAHRIPDIALCRSRERRSSDTGRKHPASYSIHAHGHALPSHCRWSSGPLAMPSRVGGVCIRVCLSATGGCVGTIGSGTTTRAT